MTKALSEREIVLGVLLEILEHDVYSHIALGNVLGKYQYLDKKERAFVTRVTEGTLEHLLELDYILDWFSKVKVKGMKPVIRNILRSALYQLKYMDSVPGSAVCNEAVKLAVKKGFSPLRGFVNGVLRNAARGLKEVEYPKEPIKALSIRYSMPEWILKKWLLRYDGQIVEKMLREFQKEKPLTIRCNTSRITPDELKKRLESEGLKVTPYSHLPYALYLSGYDYLGGLGSFREGLFCVQDISSMLVGEIALQESADYVIDVCAAPGGKATHLAERLHPAGHVEARDLSEHKTALIQENIDRLALKNISTHVMDATIFHSESVQKADVVIADIPCSGWGVLGKKSDLRYKTGEDQTRELAVLQRTILDTVWKYVKPGGTLIYSTCTINCEENEDNAEWFLQNHPEFFLENLKDSLPEGFRRAVDDKGFVQLLPGVNDSDGFFIARFKRKV